ncbi:MAG: hypothetical protein DVB23_003179 [Verrucomicrobia bacterium]|nr:MAG: hypothetical protein DVB23_003179 [Verrucomicrobiota bacterium]
MPPFPNPPSGSPNEADPDGTNRRRFAEAMTPLWRLFHLALARQKPAAWTGYRCILDITWPATPTATLSIPSFSTASAIAPKTLSLAIFSTCSARSTKPIVASILCWNGAKSPSPNPGTSKPTNGVNAPPGNTAPPPRKSRTESAPQCRSQPPCLFDARSLEL